MWEYHREKSFTVKQKNTYLEKWPTPKEVFLFYGKDYFSVIFPHQKQKHFVCVHNWRREVLIPLVYMFPLLNLSKIPP